MNYIIIYLEVKHLLNFLTREQKGRLLEVLIEYGESNTLPECEENVLNVFNFLKPRIDTQREKAELKARIARENGASGGRPHTKKKPKTTQSKPKKTDLVSRVSDHQELVEGLKFVLEAKLNKKLNCKSWSEDIRKLVEIDLKERSSPVSDIKRVIQEISNRFGEQYFPVIQSASSLREKFSKIEAAIQRNSSQSKPDIKQTYINLKDKFENE